MSLRFPLPWVLLAAAALVAPSASASLPPMREGEILIKFKTTALQSDVDSILAALHATRLKHFSRIRADHDAITGVSVEQAISLFRGHRAIEFIEPNYILQAYLIPNDPSFNLLWGLHNTGQTGGTAGADIDAVNAWDTTTGSDILVAIIDTGVDYNHPDLAANIYVNPGEIPGNGLDDDRNGFVDDVHGWDFINHDNDPFDDYGHGTHVAGTVGAAGNNGLGVVGVSWHVRLMPLKFLGSSGFGSTADAVSCVEYGTMMGVRIMSNSWGGGGNSDALRQAIQDANDAGILFVASAGNAGRDTDISPQYPSGYDVPNIISVAATTSSDDKASFSNYGATTVDLGAPGVGILSTTPGNTYSYFSGTSMAAPHVSGALALVLSRYPMLPVAEAKRLLLNTTDPLNSLRGLCVSGGRLNAARALQGPDSIPPAPILDLAALGTGSNKATLAWTTTGDDGAGGTATSYDVRFATFAISEANFDAAIQFAATPAPIPSGTHQEVVVGGLSPSTTYYFAIKVRDEYGNSSPISNVASATTLIPPDIDVTPTALSASLLSGATDVRTITLRNLTAGTLDFAIGVTPAGSNGAEGAGAPPAVALVPFQWSDYVLEQADIDSTAPPAPNPDFGTLPAAITDPAGDGGLVDLTQLRASSNQDSLKIEMEFSTPIDRLNFGGFISLDVDQNRATGLPPAFGNGDQDIGAEFEFQLFRLGSGVVSLYYAPSRTLVGSFPVAIGARTLAFGVPLSALSNDDGSMNVTGVVGDDIGPTDWFPDSGHGSIAGIRWLTVSPSTGTVPPDGSLDVQVTFGSSGLQGGAYDAAIQIASNDPDEPNVTVSAHLDLSGTPTISLSNTDLNFGSVPVGASRLDSLVVSNVGTSRLDVSAVSTDYPDFTANTPSFSLAPGEERVISIAYSPRSVGSITGTLIVASNDPESPAFYAFLSGAGIIPPNISVSPSSLSAALVSGETLTQTLAIANTGASDLTLHISVENPVTPLGAASNPIPGDPTGASSQGSTDATPVASQVGASAPARILVIQNSGAWGVSMGSLVASQFGITPTVIHAEQIAATDLTPFDLVITVGDENTSYYYTLAINQPKFEAYVSSGGIVQHQLATQGTTDVRIVAGVRAQFGNRELQNQAVLRNHPLVAGLPWILEGNAANHCYLTNLPAGAQVITETSISHLPTTVEYPFGLGKVIATGMTWEFLYYYGYPAGPILTQATAYSLSQVRPRWLRTVPSGATLQPGTNAAVQVTFDASWIPGGGHDAVIRIESDDPDEPEILVPAHLEVTPRPEISLSSSTLSFGSLFVGASRQDSVIVSNAGTDRLDVLEVTSTHPDFAADVGAFSLAPEERRAVRVTFHPSSVASIQGTLRIRSNDADEGELSIALSGTGLAPPEIAVSPASLEAALLTGQTVNQTLTIANRGANELAFALAPRATPSGAAPESTVTNLEGTSSPVPIGPTRNATSPSTELPVAGAYSGTYLQFGITDFGEIMPFQYPLGTEHLRVGAFLSGYTFAYIAGGVDHVGFAVNDRRSGIAPLSYEVLTNTPSKTVVKVVTRTSDGLMEIRRLFTFYQSEKCVRVETHLVNVSGQRLTDVVFKDIADWDVDGDYDDDTWDYDRSTGPYRNNLQSRNMVYASDERFVAIAAAEPPDLMDLYGWNDFTSRGTHVDLPVGPIANFDGLEVLHFNLGALEPSESKVLHAAYAAADNLAELREMVDRAVALPWLSFDATSGTVPAGSSVDIEVQFSTTDLLAGDHGGEIAVRSTDPSHPEVDVPVTLHVNGLPEIALSSISLSFGSVFLGASRLDSILVSNIGTDRLDVTEVTSSQGDFVADGAAFSLAPGEHRAVPVTFHPSGLGSIQGTLLIRSNDADEGELRVALSGTALAPPVISVSPSSIQSELPVDGRETRSLVVSNTGAGDLTFAVGFQAGATAVPVHEYTSYPKGAVDPRVGDPVAGGRGGPDQFGYTWLDSDEPGGPSFGWVEIGGIGTRVPIIGDDVTSSLISIGFPFTFYGRTFTSFRVCTNGFLSFTSSSNDYINQQLPNPGAPENLLAGFWSDLYLPSGAPGIFTYSDGTKMVIEFQDILHLSGAGPYTFEMILFPTGPIVFQYLSMSGFTNSATVGFQNATRDDGLTVAFNAPYLHDNLAIRASTGPPWISVNPATGTVAPGGAQTVQATLDASGLVPGYYATTLQVHSDDPITRVLDIPVTLGILGEIEAAATQIDPNTLNRDSNGRLVHAFVELPAELDPNQVVLSTVRFQGTLAPSQDSLVIGDFNGNGIADLQFEFNRDAVEEVLPEGDRVAVTATGEVQNTAFFQARDTLRVIRPRLKSPNGGETVIYGSLVPITWENPAGWTVSYADLYYSWDDGVTWNPIAQRVVGQSFAWFVPPVSSTEARVRVYLFDESGAMGYDSSDQVFAIQQLITGVDAEDSSLPRIHALFQNRPNPFNPTTSIRFDLPVASPVLLTIYAVDGRAVRTLVDRSMPAGRHRVAWDGKDNRGGAVGSGVYYYHMAAGSFRASRRLLVLK